VPYRCRRCNWRGWREHTGESSRRHSGDVHRDLTEAELEELELTDIDKGDET